ncbi:hypothetical protein SDD30_03660 [Moorella naiadis]|uniref:hypothetical protein n=1 Tax=Moorella naiadis (nom. illeg.) TaxID=3093670 RepID=UPI003D9CBB36
MSDPDKLLTGLREAAGTTIFNGWQIDENKKRAIMAGVTVRSQKEGLRRRLIAGAAAAIVLVAALTFSLPQARAGLQQVLAQAALWVKNNTSLPIYLPAGWPPADKSDQDQVTPEPTLNYYFETTATKNGYNINIYALNKPVPINQANKLQVPLSESQYVGSISGYRRAESKLQEPVWDQSKLTRARELDLGHGITAYDLDQVEVFWEKDGWRYWVVGPDAKAYAQKIVAATAGAEPIPRASGGWVKVVAGNHTTTYVGWNQGDYQYELTYRGADIARALDVARSATLWRENQQ